MGAVLYARGKACVPRARCSTSESEVMHRRTGAVPNVEYVTVPGQQRTTNVLRCARDTGVNSPIPALIAPATRAHRQRRQSVLGAEGIEVESGGGGTKRYLDRATKSSATDAGPLYSR